MNFHVFALFTMLQSIRVICFAFFVDDNSIIKCDLFVENVYFVAAASCCLLYVFVFVLNLNKMCDECLVSLFRVFVCVHAINMCIMFVHTSPCKRRAYKID